MTGCCDCLFFLNSMIFSARIRNISLTPCPVLALELKCWLPTFIAYLNWFSIRDLPFCLIERDLSIGNVTLVAGNDNGCLRWQELLKFFYPDVDLCPGLQVCDIIHNKCPYTSQPDNSHLQLLDSTLYWVRDISLAQPCPICSIVPFLQSPPVSSNWDSSHQ